jgi:Outer membrane protein beta-barrel domain
MYKIITASLLSSALISPAFAAEKAGNIGINVSFENALGIQAEFNLQKPVSLQVFLKNYSRSYYYGNNAGYYNYSYTALGVAGLYDFSKELKLANRKIHPYAGLGLYTVSSTFSGSGAPVASPVDGGLYLTVGARYEITPEIDFDGNYNNFGGLTIGANLKF